MADPDRSIEPMSLRSTQLLTDKARLSSAMHGIFLAAGFSALVAVVYGELRRIAREQGPGRTVGWVG